MRTRTARLHLVLAHLPITDHFKNAKIGSDLKLVIGIGTSLICTFLHSFFSYYIKSASTMFWKTTPQHEVLTFKRHSGYGVSGVMCNAISSPNMKKPNIFSKTLAVTSKKFNFGLIWPTYILAVFPQLVQMLCSKPQTTFNMFIPL